MKIRVLQLMVMVVLPHLYHASAQGTAFMYQGQLVSAGAPASGSFDLTFTLFSTNCDGNAIAGPLTNSATGVTNGLFTATIDFGAGVFTGSNYWLELAVQTNGGDGYTKLTPRQPIMPTPYALYAPNAGMATSAITATIADSVSASNISGTLTSGQLPFTNVMAMPTVGANLTATFITNVDGTVAMTLSGISAVQLATMLQAADVLTNGNVSISGNLAIPSTNGTLQISSGSTAYNLNVRTDVPNVPVAVLQPTNNNSAMVLDLMPHDSSGANPSNPTNQLGTGICWIHLVNRDLKNVSDPQNWSAMGLIEKGTSGFIQMMAGGTNVVQSLTLSATGYSFLISGTGGGTCSAANANVWYFGKANQMNINLNNGTITAPNVIVQTNISTGNIYTSTITATNGVILPPQTSAPTWSQIGVSNTVVLWSSNDIPPTVWKSFFDVHSNRVDSVAF